MFDRTEVGQAVDVLAELLGTVHVSAAEAQVVARDPLAFEDVERGEVAIVIVRSGSYCGEFMGERIELGAGDAVALVRIDDAGKDANPAIAAPRHSAIEIVDSRRDSGTIKVASETASLLRCRCHFDDPEKNPLLGALPSILRIASHQWVDPEWLMPTIGWIEREALSSHSGASVVVNRLVELLWIQLVRSHIATSPVATHGWLRALSDAQIGGALCLIHDKPAEQFTVAGLAQAVGMSRSAFASLFTRLVGEPPLHYVARWRMLKASLLLKEDKLTLAEVAMAVGYESEAAFSKAFKRWSGQAPGSYRRQRRSEPAPLAQMLAG